MSAFAGFDRSDYPGDPVMSSLKAKTNLVWCGYYLAPAPSHRGTSWMGKRAKLAAAGWGIAPIYVGQQVTGPGSKNPSTATGTVDGTQAASQMQSEGFAPGSSVYLDLENGPPLPQALRDYVLAWSAAVASHGYRPAIYCSHLLASSVQALLPGSRVWAFKVKTTAAHTITGPFPSPDPAGCGFPAAYIWQLEQNCQIPVAAGTISSLTVDLDTALTADPGAPDLAIPTIAT